MSSFSGVKIKLNPIPTPYANSDTLGSYKAVDSLNGPIQNVSNVTNSATPYLEYQRRLQTSPPGGRSGGEVVEIPIRNLLVSVGFWQPPQPGPVRSSILVAFYAYIRNLYPKEN